MIQPSGIINNNLTFKPGFYRVYQNVAPPAIASSGRRPWNGAFLFDPQITQITQICVSCLFPEDCLAYHTVLTDPVTRVGKNAVFLP